MGICSTRSPSALPASRGQVAVLMRHRPQEEHVKSAEEIMNMLEAFDLTGSLRGAGELAGCSHHTVAGYVAARDAGALSARPAPRVQLIDEYLDKLEEWVERSRGRIRADVVHSKLVALGYAGSERTSRRAVAAVKAHYRLGRVRVHRPWVTEPGMWLQAWARFRVVSTDHVQKGGVLAPPEQSVSTKFPGTWRREGRE